MVKKNGIDETATSDSEHLKFKGVPIDGTLTQFVTKMGIAGFKYSYS